MLCGAALMAAAPAQATSLLTTNVSAPKAVERSCLARPLSHGPGLASRTFRAPAAGLVQVRLTAAAGDWDLAVFDAKTRERVAGSAHFRSSELAEGFVGKGQRLLVQACRLSGRASSAHLSVDFQAWKSAAEKAQLVRVSTPTRVAIRKLMSLGLDLTEHGGNGFREVVLHGEADARKLGKAGFISVVRVPDLAARGRADRRADRVYARRVAQSALPSGRTTYRRLADYGLAMKQLAQDNPGLVRTITLSQRTWEGRPVEGIEITSNVNARDGKPVFLQMGVHHAREWPSGEHAMEWAYELVNGYRAGNARVTSLVNTTRTIVVPVVNPDGFNISREAGELEGGGGGRAGNETVNIVGHPYEYRRKNCRFANDSPGGSCTQPALGLAAAGVDPNRNYGGFWGGAGASSDPLNETYRGPSAFSEPETQNIRQLVSTRHVTTLVTNHTFSNLVLRAPGVASQGTSPDEAIYKALGDAMAAQNGYASKHGYELYDTTGTTEDWTYWSTGGLGFTFEIGPTNFHPPYAQVVAEYDGTTAAAGGRGGNREAYFKAQENTADASKHSVLAGQAPAGAVLRLTKSFQTPTSQRNTDGSYKTFPDTLETTTDVPASTQFEWHINPSTRPLVAQERGRVATGPPSPPQSFTGAPAPTGAVACGDFETEDRTCFNDHAFTVPSGDGSDNAKALIRIEWATIASDWDMKVYRDTNGDGSSVGEVQPIATSAQGPTDFEQATLVAPALVPGGKYVIRMINFAATEPYDGTITFEGPEPYQAAQTESWTLKCESPEGTVRSTAAITIARGQRQTLDLRAACAPAPDLQVTSLVVNNNSSVRQGDKVTVTATVTNTGATAGASTTEFRILELNQVIGSAATGSLAPGASTTVSVQWDTRSVKGTYTIRATADSAGQVTESNETNNTRDVTVTIQGNKGK
ncbi:MAG: peptidase M14 [Actinomycetota bacterium]|nr:peptidase M14 [Actinomycetota bacterium]